MDLFSSDVEIKSFMTGIDKSQKYDGITNTTTTRLRIVDSNRPVTEKTVDILSIKSNSDKLKKRRRENKNSTINLDKTRDTVLDHSGQKYNCFLGEFETQVYWSNVFGVGILHIGTLYGIFIYNIFFQGPWTLIYGFLIGGLGGFGITGGAHRYWTHKCYKAKLPLKIILLVCYSIAGQNNLLEWVRDHRVHHKFSETDADPHNSKRGFLFSHVGWLCMKKHAEVRTKGKSVDVSDISSDSLLAFHIRYWIWFKLWFCFILPTIIPICLFGETWQTAVISNCVVRYCLLLNFTWSVNSFAHIWGNRPYNRTIQPVENKFVSIVSMGEGWHNYHHSFPWDYRAAEMGTFFNITTMWINIFAKIGWAYDLKTTSSELVTNMIKNKGDGTYAEIFYK